MQSTESEIWKPVVGYEGYYEVSSGGRVRRIGGDVLKPRLSSGYLTVTLSVRSAQRVVKIHRIVAHAFLGCAPSDKHEVCHADDVKTNNAVQNLRWDTHRNNMRDMVRNGHGPTARAVCRRGLHEMTPENTVKNGGGRRLCRACRRASLKWMREEGA